MGLLSGLNKFVNNVGSGLGDIANNPLKAVNDGLNDKGTLTGLAGLAGGYGLYQAGLLGGFGGAAIPAGGTDAASLAGVMGSSGAGAGTDAVLGGSGSGFLGGLTSGLTDLGGGSLTKGVLGAGLLAGGLAGGLGKQSPPGVPDYKGAAIATSAGNRYSTAGPTGTTTWSLRPGADPNNPQPGDYIQSTQLSQGQQQLYDQGVGNRLQAGLVGGQQLKDLGGGQQGAQDALYHRLTSYYDTRFGNQENQLRTRLQNQGLVEGSEAWQNAMSDFNQTKNTAYADAADRAVIGADTTQNNAVSRLAQIMSMSQGQTPTAPSGGAGPDLLTATNQAYQAQLGNTNAANAQSNQSIQQLLQAAGLLYGVGP
jgi:hypothetical protein